MVYAFGFKNAAPVPPAHFTDVLMTTVDKRAGKKTKGPKSNVPSGEPKKLVGSNGVAAPAPGIVASPKKAKATAVVKPQKRELKVVEKLEPLKKSNKKSAKGPNDAETDDLDDLNSGEWVQVLSDKAKKALKQKEDQRMADELKRAALAAAKSPVGSETPKSKKPKKKQDKKSNVVEEVVVASGQIPPSPPNKKPVADMSTEEIQSSPIENFVVEDPEPYEEQKRVKQKTVKKVKQFEERRRKSEAEVVVAVIESAQASEASIKAPADKITAEVLATYDAAQNGLSLSTGNKKNKKEKVKKAVGDIVPGNVSISTGTLLAKESAPKPKPDSKPAKQKKDKKAAPKKEEQTSPLSPAIFVPELTPVKLIDDVLTVTTSVSSNPDATDGKFPRTLV